MPDIVERKLPAGYPPFHLSEPAFHLGRKAFLEGGLKDAKLSIVQSEEVSRRLRAIIAGKRQVVYKLTQSLHAQGFVLTDFTNAETDELGTIVEVRTIATNPFSTATIRGKEWERGFNHEYFKGSTNERTSHSHRRHSGQQRGNNH